MFKTVLMLATTLVLSPAVMSCGDDVAPGADHEVKVRERDFFQENLEVQVGETVRWVNTLSRSPENVRTVTSGLVDSTETHGLLFDVTLEGFESGEVFGQSFTHKFEERGVWHYFTRNPPNDQFTGMVVVR
jgi:plastocyanin